MKKKNVTKLILDLRDNGGGLLNAGVDVADQFLQNGQYRQPAGAQRQDRGVRQGQQPNTDYTGKLVVLVNKNSASASEVASRGLAGREAGPVVGEQTFGKGVAQIPITTVDGGKVAIVANRRG